MFESALSWFLQINKKKKKLGIVGKKRESEPKKLQYDSLSLFYRGPLIFFRNGCDI